MWFDALICLVALERIAELVVAKRNLRWALAQGGRETGIGHYPLMVVLHAGLLVGAVVEVALTHRPFLPWLGWPMVALVLASQALRWWCISSLGRQWNTRIIVIPGHPLVHRGPYRYLRHPNYLAVIVEGLSLPLVHTAWLTAAVFTTCNAGLLVIRITLENRALASA